MGSHKRTIAREGSKGQQVVILDGKNEQNALCNRLRKEIGLPANIFVIKHDGTFAKNPLFKGDDLSSPHSRAAEIAEIEKLDKATGVGLVVIKPSLGTSPEELLDCLPRIQKLNPTIKVLAIGRNREFLASSDPSLRKLLFEREVVYQSDQQIALHPRIDALITSDNIANSKLREVVEMLVPSIGKSSEMIR